MSMRVIKIIRGLVVAISAVFLPQLSYYYYNGQKVEFLKLANKGLHILTALAIPAAVGMFLIADEAVVLFFGKNFTNSIFATRILSISIATVAFSNYIGMQILVTMGKEKITTISTVCGAVTNIVLNFFLIRNYFHNGAAIASAITEGLVMIIQLVLAERYIQLKFGGKKVVIATIVMGIFVSCIKLLSVPLVFKLFLECLIGGCVYFIVLLVLKDEFANSIFNIITRYTKRK